MSKKASGKPRILILGYDVTEQIAAAGGEPVPMSYSDKRAIEAAGHDNLHGMILTGGGDVDPKIYGAKPHKATQFPYKQRDHVEMRAIQAAFEREIPILGICRGMQVLNVAFGGTLHQHLPNVPGAHRFHRGHDHRIDIRKTSRLFRAMKVASAWVVSIHHQAVDKVAPGFRVTARSRDGMPEAMELTKGPWMVGVQFHPEIDTKQVGQRIFNTLVLEAARKAGLPTPVPQKLHAYWAPAFRTIPQGQWERKADIVPMKVVDKLGCEVDSKTARNWVRPSPVAWRCFKCQIQFDERVDHVDHMMFIHGVDLLDTMTDDEIFALVGEDTK